jgi:hypothetical protein
VHELRLEVQAPRVREEQIRYKHDPRFAIGLNKTPRAARPLRAAD